MYREDQVENHISSTVVRLGPTAYIHTNSAHYTVGVTGMTIDPKTGDIKITRKSAPGEKIGVCVVEEDESVSALGVMAGCSGGGASSVIRLTDRKGKHVRADDKRFGKRANLWVLFVGYSAH